MLLRQLEREAQAASLIYETFLSRLKETSVQQGIHKADAQIISRARVPGLPSSPRKNGDPGSRADDRVAAGRGGGRLARDAGPDILDAG